MRYLEGTDKNIPKTQELKQIGKKESGVSNYLH